VIHRGLLSWFPSHTLKRSFGWITVKINNKIKHLKVPTYDDKPRSGRPPKLTPEEKDLARQYIKENPRCLKHVVERLSQKTAKRLSISSLKRLAKKAGLRWKRVRKSLKSLRDPEEFTKCQRELEALQFTTGQIFNSF
jgi:transposase